MRELEAGDDVLKFCKRNGLSVVEVELEDSTRFLAGVYACEVPVSARPNPPSSYEEESLGYEPAICSNYAYCLEDDAELPLKQYEKFLMTEYTKDSAERRLIELYKAGFGIC